MNPLDNLPRADEPRTARLGASEVAAVLGLSPWSSPFDVWATKTGLVEPFAGNAATKRGQYLERGLLDWLGDEAGADAVYPGEAFDSPWYVSEKYPHVGAHPDGALVVGGEVMGAEIKTSRGAAGWGESGTEIPPLYWCQVQVCLALTGIESWAVGAFIMQRDEFRTYRIELDPVIAPALLRKAADWWERHVLGGEPPPVDGSSAGREWLAKAYPREKRPDLRDATEAEADMVREVWRLKQEQKALKVQLAGHEARLKEAIGDDAGLVLDGTRATWKAQESARLDVRALRAAHPEIAEQFTPKRTTRVLRVSVKES